MTQVYVWLIVVVSYLPALWLFWEYFKAKKSLQESYSMRCEGSEDPGRQAANIVNDTFNKWMALILAFVTLFVDIYITYLVATGKL